MDGFARQTATFALTIALALTAVIVHGQTDTINKTDEKGLRQGYWVHYDDGKKISEGLYLNGDAIGYWKYYFPNGCIYKEGLYKIMRCKVRGQSKCQWVNDTKTSKLVKMRIKKRKKCSAEVGVWKYYSEDCTLKEVKDFKKGKKKVIHVRT